MNPIEWGEVQRYAKYWSYKYGLFSVEELTGVVWEGIHRANETYKPHYDVNLRSWTTTCVNSKVLDFAKNFFNYRSKMTMCVETIKYQHKYENVTSKIDTLAFVEGVLSERDFFIYQKTIEGYNSREVCKMIGKQKSSVANYKNGIYKKLRERAEKL